MLIRAIRQHAPEIIFCIFLLFISISNIFWIRADQSPPLWDMAGHSHSAAHIGQLMETGRWDDIVRFDSAYPPLNYIFTGLLFWMFGSHADIPQFSVVFYVLLLMGTVAMMTIQLTKNKYLAIAAAALTFFYPQLSHFSRIYDLDYQLVTVTTLSLAFYLKSQRGNHRAWTLAFGAVLGLTFLTKWTAVVFIAPPILTDLFFAWRKKEFNVFAAQNFCLATVVAGLIAAPWYLAHVRGIFDALQGARRNGFSVPTEDLWSVKNIVYYAHGTIKGVGFLISLVLVPVLIIAGWRHRQRDLFLLAWVFGAYFIMTFLFFSKEPRYLLPIFPALAILTVLSVEPLRKNFQRVLLGVICGIALFFWVDTTWGMTFTSQKWEQKSIIARWTYGYFPPAPNGIPYGLVTPSQYHTNLREITERIRRDQAQFPKSRPTNIVVVPNSIYLTAAQIQFAARLSGLDHPNNTFRTDYRLSSEIRHQNWREDILKGDYLITKTGNQGPVQWAGFLPEIAREEANPNSEIFRQFQLLQTWKLYGVESNPQEARLYRRNKVVAD
ncbi:MAG: phospholipid carrier-dependent glycosyltransferase [Patescibacteria group bacterium]|mgnify:CR=1 FL=1